MQSGGYVLSSNDSSSVFYPQMYSFSAIGNTKSEVLATEEGLSLQEEANVGECPTQLAKKIITSKWHFGLLITVTIASLVLDDVRVLALPASLDGFIDSLYLCFVLLYCWDIVLQMSASEDYFGSLYFGLDLLAVAGVISSLAPIHIESESLCHSIDFRCGKVAVYSARLSVMTISLIRHLNQTEAFTLKHRPIRPHRPPISPSLSPLMPQLPRIIRSNSNIVSLPYEPAFVHDATAPVRHRRIDRQCTDTTNTRKTPRRRGTLYRLWKEGAIGKKFKEGRKPQTEGGRRESGVSKRVSKRLVGMVATLGVLVAGFEWGAEIAADYEGMDRFALRLLISGLNTPRAEEFVEAYVSRYRDDGSLTVLTHLEIGGRSLWDNTDFKVREKEKCTLTEGPAVAEFSIRDKLRAFAVCNLLSTALLCGLFLYVTLDSSAHIRKMVLFPLEQMVKTVQLMWSDPLGLTTATHTFNSPSAKNCCKSPSDYIAEQEVYFLENAFRKIGLMLGLVYGSAGSEMITSSIGLQGQFTPLVPGKKILAIFCFAKIGEFDSALNILGPNILAYINLISGFVHSMSERYLGSVNKNLGDSYLLVWKSPAEDGYIANRQLILNPYSPAVRTGTSLALLFAIKTISKVACSPLLLRYHTQFSASSQPSHHLTFGFHIGWAFEGPIGSAFKIDASYLSPNVNMAARIQTAACQYGVSILLSHDMYIRLEAELREYVRHIDTVKLKGVSDPVLLYSFDFADAFNAHTQRVPTKRETLRKREHLLQALEEGYLSVSQMFAKSETVAFMRRKHPNEFFNCYDTALLLYFKGQWRESCQIFATSCLSLVPFDGPTRTLMAFMEGCKLQPPKDWQGVRELISK